MKKLYSMNFYDGRAGKVEGLFVADEKQIAEALGKTVYFGEILGKHSEVDGELDAEMFTVKSEDQTLLKQLINIFQSETISGYNPLQYIRENEEE